jgi:hypothetical protein
MAIPNAPGVLVDDEVGVALAEAGVGVGQPVPLVGQRADGLGEQGEAFDHDAQPPLRAVITVPSALTQSPGRAAEGGEGVVADDRAETNSWISAPRSRIVAKISLPCWQEHHPPGDGDGVLGLGAGRQIGVRRPTSARCASGRSGRVGRPAGLLEGVELTSRLPRSAARPEPLSAASPARSGVGLGIGAAHEVDKLPAAPVPARSFSLQAHGPRHWGRFAPLLACMVAGTVLVADAATPPIDVAPVAPWRRRRRCRRPAGRRGVGHSTSEPADAAMAAADEAGAAAVLGDGFQLGMSDVLRNGAVVVASRAPGWRFLISVNVR